MIDYIRCIVTKNTEPYLNQALEEFLLGNVHEDECILYLWQNRQTVVIGRNQNCFKECKVEQLEKDGGFLARRLSGGGAVYHDMGNLNFTFLACRENYDVDRQMEVILSAVQKWGIHAEKTGRNDITIDGSKFSGNAFYGTGGRKYHHGTILIHVDIEELSHYLNVSAEKMRSKGVSSVRSRVANLTDFNPKVTVDGMIQSLKIAFGDVYGLVPSEMAESAIDREQIEKLADKYASGDWKYGRRIECTYETSKRFDWGDIQIQMKISGNKIMEAAVFSDALEADYVAQIRGALIGLTFTGEAIQRAIGLIPADNDTAVKMSSDIQDLLRSECG